MALPRKYREAVYLHYYEGYSVREIASLLGQSESAVSAHLSRGRKSLRTTLGGIFMNREYNDNKMYNSALDELRFSEEAKSRMVNRLMAAAEQPEQPVAIHRVRRFPRIAAVGVAAALVLSIGAGATGVFKSASDAFAGVFGPTADTEIIDQIGHPIGASDTAGGVTVTADAILFDGYNYLISYTLEKEDGSSFDLTTNPDTGLLDLYWADTNSDIGLFGGAIGNSYFYDADPNDNAIQYVETRSFDDAVKVGGTAKIKLHDLQEFSNDGTESTLVKGTWSLKFKLDADNSAKELPAGQNLTVNGMNATVDKLVISPIGYNFTYTVAEQAKFEDAPSGRSTAVAARHVGHIFGSAVRHLEGRNGDRPEQHRRQHGAG